MEGVEVCSSCGCVRTEKTWLALNGETKWVPAGSVSPVTRPKNVSTPTLPGGTYAIEAQARIMNSTRPMMIRMGVEAARGFALMILGSKCAMQSLLGFCRLCLLSGRPPGRELLPFLC